MVSRILNSTAFHPSSMFYTSTYISCVAFVEHMLLGQRISRDFRGVQGGFTVLQGCFYGIMMFQQFSSGSQEVPEGSKTFHSVSSALR